MLGVKLITQNELYYCQWCIKTSHRELQGTLALKLLQNRPKAGDERKQALISKSIELKNQTFVISGLRVTQNKPKDSFFFFFLQNLITRKIHTDLTFWVWVRQTLPSGVCFRIYLP